MICVDKTRFNFLRTVVTILGIVVLMVWTKMQFSLSRNSQSEFLQTIGTSKNISTASKTSIEKSQTVKEKYTFSDISKIEGKVLFENQQDPLYESKQCI